MRHFFVFNLNSLTASKIAEYRFIKVKQYNGGDLMKSIWDESCEFDKREELKGDIKTDILIIGAGITGILIGYF
jgi:hypothetical protein